MFILGVGGSAANASHAVNDFRKLCDIEAYAPTDNVSELTARTNDDGWARVFADWLKTSRANADDAILVFSVGGGDLDLLGRQRVLQRGFDGVGIEHDVDVDPVDLASLGVEEEHVGLADLAADHEGGVGAADCGVGCGAGYWGGE